MQTLEAASIQQFQCAFANFVATAGVLSGEYWVSNGFVDSHPWEWRGVVQIKGAPGSCPTTRGATSLGFYTATATIPIASYAEAQLILAEASADETEKLAAINRVRALTNIAPLVGPVTDDIIIEERRRQLFSEGQRYVDMLRKKLPFQSGTNHKGQTYSDLTCIPLPDVETQNNPNLKG